MINKGKKFESQFKQDWEKSFPKGVIIRLPDQQSGYYGTSANICDFVCFTDGILFLVECKSHAGNTFPFSCLSQLDKLKKYIGIDNVVPCVILWLYDIDKVFFLRADEIVKMIEDGKKSFNGKNIDENYNFIQIPSSKKRAFMSSDYSIIVKENSNGN